MELPGPHPMEHLKRMLDSILEVIPPGSQIVYMDYPVHENIGDLLIMKGTEKFFHDHRIRVRKRLSFLQFRSRMRIPSDWIIVCHGGGNFGDLYTDNQKLRETLVATYPTHRIVVLPQTVFFSDAGERERSLGRFANHPDFHLFVRDLTSYETVRGNLANVYLCPDMAHRLYPIQAPPNRSAKVLGLFRTDGEAGHHEAGECDCDTRTDWPQLLSGWDFLLLRLMVKGFVLDRYLMNLLPLRPVWYRMADRFVAKAVRLYGSFGSVVTSRLHGHILACLMDLPNRLIDNNYGKNSSYYRQWTHRIQQEGMPSESSAGNDRGGLYAESS
ncbi:exopolysaccharide biosynthesis protein [Cohnella sp. CFH 77786]|uniref:polysaccharide pyruvyl transferase family protein n=1 Tax=Cohnella sp. CFH 77786 TaxID=2662265 RepID=UPI001C60C0D0|nr:polysaccharide pyruvyl transferase family protein [Cohnella sp. CFH 77786]MBW5448381.1 exopolysaccharide biosynthesis protein [Cohnella sp. CFH 77786]